MYVNLGGDLKEIFSEDVPVFDYALPWAYQSQAGGVGSSEGEKDSDCSISISSNVESQSQQQQTKLARGNETTNNVSNINTSGDESANTLSFVSAESSVSSSPAPLVVLAEESVLVVGDEGTTGSGTKITVKYAFVFLFALIFVCFGFVLCLCCCFSYETHFSSDAYC
jgi:hypothetical protein